MSQYNLYQAPLPKQIISFPIALFDGTKSMKREYNQIIQIYGEVFNDFSETERLQYQWTKGLNWINPYIGSDFGDLTQTMSQLFLILLANQYPQYMTMILVTDGEEPFDSESLQNQIQEVKCKYFIQFITIVISEQPQPNKILKKLNTLFKPQDNHFQSQYIIKRSQRKSIFEIQNNFREAFTNIKRQLVVYQQNSILNQNVRTIINQSELTNEITPGNLFLVEKGQEIWTENVKLQSTKQIIHILQMLQKSFLNTLMKSPEITSQELKNECSEIQRVINDLLKEIDNNNNNNQEEYQAIQLILTIIKSINNNTCNWQKIDSQLFNDLLLAVQNAKVNQLKQLASINQSELCIQKINQINEQMISKLDKLLESEKIYLDFLIKLENIIFDSLKIYSDLFSTEIKYLQDQKAHLKKFITLLKNHLSIVFETIFKQKLFKENYHNNFEQSQRLFKLNDIIKQLKQILMDCQSEQFLNSINQLIKLEGNSNNQLFVNIILYYQDLNELPFIQQQKPKNIEEDNESIFILLINMNETMKQYIVNLEQSYKEGFKEIQNSKKIEIVYVNRKENNQQTNQEFYFLNQDQLQNNRYNSLIELFEKHQEQFQLKKKNINICIISDDQQNYWKLHLQIRMLEFSQYYVKLIYIALGLEFHLFISKEIEQFEKQQFYQQKPFQFVIPKSKYNQKKKDVEQFQLKIFQEIAKKFKQNKL